MGTRQDLINKFKGTHFTLQEAYEAVDAPKESIRARIYENLGFSFERISKGIYRSLAESGQGILIEGDGRDLSMLKDASVDAIITDHPWEDEKSNKGGNRAFAEYNCFRYTKEDFAEKARVLKEGCFLAEFLPAENASNYEYLYQLKKMAEEAGLQYYTKVAWVKTGFVANTGRKAKNTEEVLLFTKGKARNLRPDAKKNKAEPNIEHFMSGARGMFPTAFHCEPPKKVERIHQAEKPVALLQEIMELISFPGDTILDQFAGSGATGVAAVESKRHAIMIEMAVEAAQSIRQRFEKLQLNLAELKYSTVSTCA